MRLKVLLPIRILIDEPVDKVIAEAENGSFCLLPRHVDMTAALVPGLLSYESTGLLSYESKSGGACLLGIDEGILVKCGSEVLVSILNAVPGDDLGTLRNIVRRRFVELEDYQRIARSALARLEGGVVRRFLQIAEPVR